MRVKLDRRFGILTLALGAIGSWVLALTLLSGCANFDPNQLGQVLGGSGTLDDGTITAGLREALTVGTGRAVETVSVTDGFLGDTARRILLPQELQSAASKARQLGFGSQVDEFETLMNRAAEEAAGEAVDVFANAVRSMSWQDVRGILNGPDDAATAFFRARTSDELTARFRPIVDAKMETVGLVRAWNQARNAWSMVQPGGIPSLDLGAYVTDRTLEGLFGQLAVEERRIREDPVARTTALLQKVFGPRG
ncbi:MAG: DUF4197 domain-containing protein [Gemmatimonadetes bacterium]|nr:DUF4197 domain-containing protein [Gemmatimonadota bacterium]